MVDAEVRDPEAGGRLRRLSGPLATALRVNEISIAVIGALWAINFHHFFDIAIFREQYLGLLLTMALTEVFLVVPPSRHESMRRVRWFDWVLSFAALVIGLYIVVWFPKVIYDLGAMTPDRWLLGGIAVVVILEATRRMTGWALVILALAMILYARYCDLFPGLLNMPSTNWDRLTSYLYLDTNALLGLPLQVSGSILISYLLFGRVLYAVNGDKFLTDFALAAMGRYRGGPAKVAVVASGFFGTLSGNVVSNVMMDGPITIPMMRKSGYKAHVAAAVEAVSSTGGQIMPPVMGITAFLIAEYLQVSYGEVVLAAIAPALLYYLGVFTQVDLEAARQNLVGLPRHELPRMREVMKRGYVFFVPIVVLLWTLIIEGWQPEKSAIFATALTVVVSMIHPQTRPTAARLLAAFRETGETMLNLVVITAVAGLIIGGLQISGLSFNFSIILLEIASGNVFALLGLTAVICIILGMGMPTAVIYVLLAVLVAPGLIEFGVAPMAAHMFLFYFGMLSMITPPVCFASMAAAAIANTSFWKTGWAGMRLGIVAYIVPFTFVFQPGILLQGDLIQIILGLTTATIGVVTLSFGLVGYLRGPLSPVSRTITCAAGLLLLLGPPVGHIGLVMNGAGLALVVLVALVQLRAPRLR